MSFQDNSDCFYSCLSFFEEIFFENKYFFEEMWNQLLVNLWAQLLTKKEWFPSYIIQLSY